MPSYAQVHLAVERIPPGPWIYARLTDDAGPGGPPAGDGDIVEVVDGAGRFCGHGLYNSTSDIRIRMLSRGRRTDLDRPREFLRRAIAAAVRLRRKVLRLDADCDAYRLVHAEGDDLPGLVVDKLGDALVCQHHALGFWRLRHEVDAVLRELLPGHAVVHRFARTARGAEGFPEDDPGGDGDEVGERYVVEHGVRFLVRPGASHKTGWFCDQRDNRRRIASFAEGRDVLDLCCHAGGFSLPAALSGARSVTAVDLDEEPIERAGRAAAENGVDVTFRHADAFDVLTATTDKAQDVLYINTHNIGFRRDDELRPKRGHLTFSSIVSREIQQGQIPPTGGPATRGGHDRTAASGG